MILNEKSFHVKLYELVYSSSLPKNLCPYFWKLVLAIFFAIPNFIIQFPAWIFNFIDKEEFDNCAECREKGGVIYFILAILFGYTYITVHWIKAMFNCYSYNYKAANGAIFIHVVIGVILLYFGIRHLIKKRQDNKPYKEDKPNIVIEFVKAKYSKYCPIIEWDND